MKGFLLISMVLFASFLNAQSMNELVNADGVYISYNLRKIDSSSTKRDKYLLEIVYENKNDYDLVYLASPPSTNGSFTFSTPSYIADIEVANTVSIFGQKMSQTYSLSGTQANIKTDAGKLIFIVPKGRKVKTEYNIPAKKDLCPVISGSIKQKFYKFENLY